MVLLIPLSGKWIDIFDSISFGFLRFLNRDRQAAQTPSLIPPLFSLSLFQKERQKSQKTGDAPKTKCTLTSLSTKKKPSVPGKRTPPLLSHKATNPGRGCHEREERRPSFPDLERASPLLERDDTHICVTHEIDSGELCLSTSLPVSAPLLHHIQNPRGARPKNGPSPGWGFEG